MLLMDAIHRDLAVAKEIAVFAMVVDADDENARRLYEGFGCIPLAEAPTRLVLPLSSVGGVPIPVPGARPKKSRHRRGRREHSGSMHFEGKRAGERGWEDH